MATPFKTFGPFVWMGALFGSLMLTGCTLEAVIGEPDASTVSVGALSVVAGGDGGA